MVPTKGKQGPRSLCSIVLGHYPVWGQSYQAPLSLGSMGAYKERQVAAPRKPPLRTVLNPSSVDHTKNHLHETLLHQVHMCTSSYSLIQPLKVDRFINIFSDQKRQFSHKDSLRTALSDSNQTSKHVLRSRPTGGSRTLAQGWYQEGMEIDDKWEPQPYPEHSSGEAGQLMIGQGLSA